MFGSGVLVIRVWIYFVFNRSENYLKLVCEFYLESLILYNLLKEILCWLVRVINWLGLDLNMGYLDYY